MGRKDLYNGEYAAKWIDYETRHQDVYREKFILPHLKFALKTNNFGTDILDVGCGWGAALEFISESCRYTGIDPTPEFFNYIKNKKHHKNICLLNGNLPNLPVKDNSFDIVLCCMVLHCVPDFKSSIDSVISKTKNGGKVIIVDFKESAEQDLRKLFREITVTKPNYIKGLYDLSSDIKLYGEIFFRKEKEFEKRLTRRGQINKKYLGPLFVGYELIKKSA